MRIAFSGSHRSGKSTLLEHVSELLPRYATVDEPYYQLEEEGYETAETPSIDDFEAQLEKSLSSLEEDEPNVLFDRCPADVLAYLLTHDDGAAFDADAWLDRVGDAMATLDLVVFVPIEARDRIPVPAHEDRRQRLAVHEMLEEIFLENSLSLDIEILRVEGDVESRVKQVMARIKAVASRG